MVANDIPQPEYSTDVIVKTIDKHVQDIEDIVKEHYKDGVPCVATISLYRLNRDFKDWLMNSLG